MESQFEREFSDDEWERFLECGRARFASGEALHADIDVKLGKHHVREQDIERAFHQRSYLLRYYHYGDRIAWWNPHQQLLVIAKFPSLCIFSAFYPASGFQYVERMDDIKWLKR